MKLERLIMACLLLLSFQAIAHEVGDPVNGDPDEYKKLDMIQLKGRHLPENSHKLDSNYPVTFGVDGKRYYDMDLCHPQDPNACGGESETYACLELFGHHGKCFRRCDANGQSDCSVYSDNVGHPKKLGDAICVIPMVNPIEIGAAGRVPPGIRTCAIRSNPGTMSSPFCRGLTIGGTVVIEPACVGKCPNNGVSLPVGLSNGSDGIDRCH